MPASSKNYVLVLQKDATISGNFGARKSDLGNCSCQTDQDRSLIHWFPRVYRLGIFLFLSCYSNISLLQTRKRGKVSVCLFCCTRGISTSVVVVYKYLNALARLVANSWLFHQSVNVVDMLWFILQTSEIKSREIHLYLIFLYPWRALTNYIPVSLHWKLKLYFYSN